MGDVTASKYFKEKYPESMRPCAEHKWVRVPDGCRGTKGFASSHSANAVSVLVGLWLLRKKFGLDNKPFFIVGSLFVIGVGWSRVYLAKHLPSQVLNGYLVGFFVTLSMTYLMFFCGFIYSSVLTSGSSKMTQ